MFMAEVQHHGNKIDQIASSVSKVLFLPHTQVKLATPTSFINFEVFILKIQLSRDSAVGIATGYWLGDRGVGVRVPVGSRFFTSACRPDRVWGPPKVLGLFLLA
jgi:hypothetical protein